MPCMVNSDAGRRRYRRATGHLKHVRSCPRCGKVVKGNGYGNHKRACKAREEANRHA